MKKKLFVFLVASFCSFPTLVQAQNESIFKWEISPSVGMMTSYIGFENRLLSNQMLAKPIFGASIVRNLDKRYYLKIQANYIRMGKTQKYGNPFGGLDIYQDESIFPYLQSDITINSSLNSIKLKSGNLSIGIGFFFGKILNPYVKTRRLDKDSCTCKDGTITNYSSFNWGITASADWNLQSAMKIPISLTLKYNLGISDIRDSAVSPITGIKYDGKVTSNAISLQLNYWFKLNNKNHEKDSFIKTQN
jgi:hypothetical protein